MQNNLYEVARIMGVDEETIKILPKIKFKRNLLNPWGDQLLDTLCGQGGISVHLAKKYGVVVEGYDLLQGFVDHANEYATKHHVQNLCSFLPKTFEQQSKKGKNMIF